MAIIWFEKSKRPLRPPYPDNRLIFDVLPELDLMEDDRKDYLYLPDLQKVKLEDIISEAIYFHNFSNFNAIKGKWKLINSKSLNGVLEEIRWNMHNNYADQLNTLANLSTNKDNVKYFGKYYNENQHIFHRVQESNIQPTYWDPTNRARFAVRMWISPNFRSAKLREIHHDVRYKKGWHYGLYLDQIVSKLKIGRQKLKQVLSNLPKSPTHSIRIYWVYDLDRKVNLINAHFGKIYKQILETYKDKSLIKYNEPTPIKYLTEFLYMAVQHPGLGESHLPLRSSKRKKIDNAQVGTIFSDFYEYSKIVDSSISLIFPTSYNRYLSVFQAWEKQLDMLYNIFTPSYNQDPIIREQLGLDWSLVLLISLKWYFTEIKIRILMSALPVWYFYETLHRNSYIGLSLWEACTGLSLKLPSLPNILNVELPVEDTYKVDANFADEDARYPYINPIHSKKRVLIGALKNWQYWMNTSLFQSLSSSPGNMNPIVPFIEDTLRNFTRNPLIIKSEKAGRKTRTFTADTFDGVLKGFIRPFTPILQRKSGNVNKKSSLADRPDYFKLTNVIRNPVSVLNFGARFTVQLQYFVANEILAMVGESLELSEHYDTQYQGNMTNKASELKALRATLRSLNKSRTDKEQKEYNEARLEYQKLIAQFRLAMNSGSYLCGGSFPPHKTHRDGRHFDTNMGPDTIPWRSTKLHTLLRSAYSLINEFGTDEDKKLVNTYNTYYPIYVVEQLPKDATLQTKMRVNYVDVRTLADETLKQIHQSKSTDLKDLSKLEANLHGTPHYQSKNDGELSQIGTLSILLSAPERIVYSSPIVQARAIWIIRKEFQAADDQINSFIGMSGIWDNLIPVVNKVTDPTSGCDFAFLPADHHNHWHLYYRKENALDWIKSASRLWLQLNIDLSPIIVYLKAHQELSLLNIDPDDPYDSYLPVLKEWREVNDFCVQYELDRESLNEEPFWSEGDARDLIARLFMSVSSNKGSGELLTPMAEKQASSKLRDFSTQLHNHLLLVRSAITQLLATVQDPKGKEEITKLLFDFSEQLGLNSSKLSYQEFSENISFIFDHGIEFLEGFGELDGGDEAADDKQSTDVIEDRTN